ncbi:MAG: hypothetical protein WC477_06890 [Patescibacteria group bacterium]
MHITRTSIYNVYGLTAKEKSVIFNALSEYGKRFGAEEPIGALVAGLAAKFSLTDEADVMGKDEELSTIESLRPKQ